MGAAEPGASVLRSQFWCKDESHTPIKQQTCPRDNGVYGEICGEEIQKLTERWGIKAVFFCRETGCVEFECDEYWEVLLKKRYGYLDFATHETAEEGLKNSIRVAILSHQLRLICGSEK